MVVSFVTGMWKRPEVFEIFAKGIKQIQDNTSIIVHCIVSGSEGSTSRNQAEKYGFHYIETNNYPLSDKMNQPLQIAKKLNSDYVICLGSDDVIELSLFNEYVYWMNKGYDFIGLLDFYFLNLPKNKAVYWRGYRGSRKGDTVGAVRCVSKWLLDQLDWELWQNGLMKGLDASMKRKLADLNYREKKIRLKDLGLYAMDIKTEENITEFKQYDNSVFINATALKSKFNTIFV
jgi:hypothetical protein